jgi:hypothetical protein
MIAKRSLCVQLLSHFGNWRHVYTVRVIGSRYKRRKSWDILSFHSFWRAEHHGERIIKIKKFKSKTFASIPAWLEKGEGIIPELKSAWEFGIS